MFLVYKHQGPLDFLFRNRCLSSCFYHVNANDNCYGLMRLQLQSWLKMCTLSRTLQRTYISQLMEHLLPNWVNPNLLTLASGKSR